MYNMYTTPCPIMGCGVVKQTVVEIADKNFFGFHYIGLSFLFVVLQVIDSV